MKPIRIALAIAFLLGFIGCVNEGPTGEEVGQQLGRGIRGEGQLSPDIDRTGDPYVKTREGADRTRE